MYKKLIALLAPLLIVLSLFTATACAAPNGYVHVSGSQLVDGNGNAIKLRGVALGTWLLQEPWLQGGTFTNTGMTQAYSNLAGIVGTASANQFQQNYESTFVTANDFAQIKAAGFNTVRVPFNYREIAQGNWTYLDNAVQWAQNNGLYVILDMHAAPGGQNASFIADTNVAALWYTPTAQNQTVSIWQAIAARYATRTNVLGYDLLNEPSGLFMTNSGLVNLYNRIINAIRSVDTNHVVIVEGKGGNDGSAFTKPFADNNVMLSFHQYQWANNINSVMSNSASAAARLGNVPIWVGEMGLDTPNNVQTQVTTFDSDSSIVGWSYWTWKDCPSGNMNAIQEYSVTQSWVNLIDYMENTSKPRPTIAQANQGMSDYLNSIQNTVTNSALLSVLQAG